MKCAWGKLGLFAGGLLFGTAGLKILSSKEAKKAYTYTTAAALRAKEDGCPRRKGKCGGYSCRCKGAQRKACRRGRGGGY